MAVADLHGCTHGRFESGERNPIDVSYFAGLRTQLRIFADDYAVGCVVKFDDVKRSSHGDAQPLTLSDGVMVHSAMPPNDFAAGRYEVAFFLRHRFASFPQIRLDKLNVVSRWHEANFLAFRLFRHRQRRLARNFPHSALVEFAERKVGPRHLLLLQTKQKIGLILGPIHGAQQFVTPGKFIAANSGVVAGRQAVGSDLPRSHEQRIELHVVVAMSARNRGAPGEILLNEWLHHGFFEPLFVVHHVVRHSQVLRHALRVVHVIERAAALSVRAITVELRQAALVPELHRQADHRKPALDKHRRDSRAVNAAAHGDCG